MEIQTKQSSWENILEKCIGDLKEAFPRLNDGQVADRIKIPRATFNRIKNEQKIPRLENMIKLIIGSGTKELSPKQFLFSMTS